MDSDLQLGNINHILASFIHSKSPYEISLVCQALEWALGTGKKARTPPPYGVLTPPATYSCQVCFIGEFLHGSVSLRLQRHIVNAVELLPEVVKNPKESGTLAGGREEPTSLLEEACVDWGRQEGAPGNNFRGWARLCESSCEFHPVTRQPVWRALRPRKGVKKLPVLRWVS